MFFIFYLFFISFLNSVDNHLTVTIDEKIHEPIAITEHILNTTENPQIAIWYIGESGIAKEGAKFYQENIFAPFKQQSKPYTFHLYDLVAWQVLRNPKSCISTTSKIANHINALNLSNFKAIPSSAFFQDLASLEDSEIINYYNNAILKNDYLMTNSAIRRPNNMTVGSVTPYESLRAISHIDTAHAYSAYQYLEGLFLAKKMVQSSKSDKKDVIFLLPNDELKYYITPQLKEDLYMTLKKELNNAESIHVGFHAFKFTDDIKNRPYIMRDKKATPKEIEIILK